MVWDGIVTDVRELPEDSLDKDKQIIFQDGQTVTIDYIDPQRDERLFLQVHEPCAQDNNLGKQVCGLVKKMESKACHTLMITANAENESPCVETKT